MSKLFRPGSIIPAHRISQQKPSIWVEINKIVAKYKPVNMGQGFPDIQPVQHLKDNLSAACSDKTSHVYYQYTRSMGHMDLVNVLARFYTPYYQQKHVNCSSQPDSVNGDDTFQPDRKLDPVTEILVSIGAYEALYTAFMTFVDPGDEVIIFDPSFDCYAPMTRLCGGVPVFVPLLPVTQPGEKMISDCWRFDPKELESKITSRTKLIVLNTPHNPLGKVFDIDELQIIADLCIKHNLLCVSDEVYEFLVFKENKEHVKIASLPGMWSRTLTIGSAGKTFGATGLRLGWTIASANLIEFMQLLHQNVTFTCPTMIQEAVARSLDFELSILDSPDSYFTQSRDKIKQSCLDMSHQLASVGMTPIRPSAGYFLIADISKMDVSQDELEACSGENASEMSYDMKFNNWMIQRKGVSAIPMSVFYSDENKHLGSKYIRFCFFKCDSTLEKCFAVLKKWND